jgi:hypothetical protein
MWEIRDDICQSCVMEGFWSARETVRESPSKIKEEIFKEITN